MSFAWPFALLALLVLPLLAFWYLRLERRRSRTVERFARRALWPNLAAGGAARARHVPPLVALFALVVLLVGLARPRAALPVTREEGTIVLAIDSSRSMAATDVRPSRLAVAQAAARRLVRGLPAQYRVAVVAFSGGAQIVAPAVFDRALVLRAISELRPGTATTIGEAIKQAVRAGQRIPGLRGQSPPAAVLLFSDGAQTEGDLSPEQAARQARVQRVTVSSVLVGSAQGVVRVPLGRGLVERVSVPADPQTMRQIASLGGGHFYANPNAGLTAVYQRLGKRIVRGSHRRELTDLFAGAGALLFLLSSGLSALLLRHIP